MGEARNGDFSAFERLYRRHVGRIHAVCMRMTADAARAEDLTQQAFIQAWLRLGSLRDDGGFAPWLKRVAINVVLSDGRARGRRHEQAVDDVEKLHRSTAPSHQGPGLDLERAVADLPAGAREVFVLHDVEGYRHDEIGDLLDIAPGTSKSRLHRARGLLREALRS